MFAGWANYFISPLRINKSFIKGWNMYIYSILRGISIFVLLYTSTPLHSGDRDCTLYLFGNILGTLHIAWCNKS